MLEEVAPQLAGALSFGMGSVPRNMRYGTRDYDELGNIDISGIRKNLEAVRSA